MTVVHFDEHEVGLTEVVRAIAARDGGGAPPSDEVFLRIVLTREKPALVAAMKAASWVRSVHRELEVTGVSGIERVAFFVWPNFPGRARALLVDVVRINERVLDAPLTLTLALAPGERPRPRNELPAVTVRADDAGPTPQVESPSPATAPRGPAVLRLTGTDGKVREWAYASGEGGSEKEVERLTKDGAPVLRTVNTDFYAYRMICDCGRVRYAMSNSIHQIVACRVCSRQSRLRKRALTQYRSRYGIPRNT